MSEPIGSLCVMRDASRDQWVVGICEGHGYKYPLRRFGSPDEATEFAIEERARRIQMVQGASLTIHFPDDCPCAGDGKKW